MNTGLARAVCAGVGWLTACSTHTRLELLEREPIAVTNGNDAPVEPARTDAAAPATRPQPQPTAAQPSAPSQPGQMPGDAGCPTQCPEPEYVLSFQAPYDHVEVMSAPELDLPQDFTIEAWVWPRSYSGGHNVINRWVPGKGDFQITFGVPEPLSPAQLPPADPVPSRTLAAWAWTGESGVPDWVTAYTQDLPALRQWHHLAACYGGGSFRLYVDGRMVSSEPGTKPAKNPDASFYIGATARHQRPLDNGEGWWPPLDSVIRDVRLSAGDRYQDNFEPEPRLAPDGQTIALWPLDEGAGNVARDLGPSHLDGVVHGARWVEFATATAER